MNINRNNYELYMIDYLDGQLDAVAVSELLLFVEQNPDIKQEFALLEKTNLVADKEEGIDKSILKKPGYNEVKLTYEDKLIASLEGDLGLYDQYKLEQSFVVYPELKKDAELFNKTKLQPDLTVVFPQKKSLKKGGANIFSLSIHYGWRIAAVLIAFALIVFFIRIPKQQSTSENTLIIKKSPIEKQIVSSAKETSKVDDETKDPAIKKSFSKRNEQFTSAKLKPVLAQVRNNQIKLKIIESIHTPIKKIQLNNLVANSVSAYVPTPALYTEKDDTYKNLVQLASDKITKDVLVEQNKPDSLQDKHLLSNMGLLFVKLYNKATGDSAKVVRQYGNDGNLTRVTIVADNFEFSTRK